MSTTENAVATYPSRYFAAWTARDVDVVDEILAEELSWQDPSLPAELTNRKGARAFFEGSWAAFPDLAFAQLGASLVGEDGRVAGEWRMTGTHEGEFNGVPATGKSFSVDGTDVFTVGADGRARQIRAYWDVVTLLRQLGLA